MYWDISGETCVFYSEYPNCFFVCLYEIVHYSRFDMYFLKLYFQNKNYKHEGNLVCSAFSSIIFSFENVSALEGINTRHT